jgi:TolB-like protein/Flp pilus assembly protein TadD/predicted Ser/Thr protein kinase
MVKPGGTISHYTILEKLGEGGMGVVYKATDTRLDRTVALKFLPPHRAGADRDRERFIQEARTAAGLSHPGICTIHDVVDEGENPFIVMEFVEGETLRSVVARAPLPPKEAIGVATQIADALEAAHAKGIVHRDVKSENIMLTPDGRAKVMDFGLARLRGAARLTRSASTVGTLGYMSPEQVQGQEADARSDLFSLGVVLYEMLAGRLPFPGEHEAAMVYAIVNQEPDPLERTAPNAPAEVRQVVAKALEKNPAERYQSARELAVDLRRAARDSSRISSVRPVGGPATPAKPATKKLQVRTIAFAAGAAALLAALAFVVRPMLFSPGGTDTSRKMLVVLPFENLGAPDQEYFADGITEEITSRLSGVPGLGVIARSSARTYKGGNKTLRQIADELDVDYVLQGTIRWDKTPAGEPRVRVTPELIRTSDGTQVWSKPQVSVLSEVFALQSSIAAEVSGALGVTLSGGGAGAEAPPTTNAAAYDLYLRGMDYYNRSYALQDYRIAEDFLGRAIEMDPSFALAHARLSRIHSSMLWQRADNTPERAARALESASTAIRLQGDLPEAHVAMGFYHYHCRLDYDSAVPEFEKALELHAGHQEALEGLASVYRRQGKVEEAAAIFEQGAKTNPRDFIQIEAAAGTLGLLRRFEASLPWWDKVIQNFPDQNDGYVGKSAVLLAMDGNTKRAREVLRRANEVVPDNQWVNQANVVMDIFDRRYAEALAGIKTLPPVVAEQFSYLPRQLFEGRVRSWMGDERGARAAFDSARAILEEATGVNPADERFHGALGITLAGLGRKEAAIASARKGVQLMPFEKEAWRGSYRRQDLAEVYATVGEADLAVKELEFLLSRPGPLTLAELRLNPVWDPVRKHPGFISLVQRGQ